ncbi:FadR/GntR family transcriptional regulator [Desulfoscipio geothermicus]|uniref:Transcriptional regulator, GntR family n=1 Tax=Desulfoscipio geothermicus DSM 3669 TaxID=1121426 RepID=A0A1I6D4H2_9FIRM|nr:FadR/GntR family transcriptional regulator [Desulfoscipio geothermicus]SFR00202.1 transcriptional regulator, GntR family [Desulfoscipio geothermicus DSM 3669]
MEFKPIKTKKIYEEIIDQVKAMIGSGTLRPGDRLMSERELAEKLQVGRSAVREAFRVMEAMGILKIKPGEGTYISEQSVESLVSSFSPVLLADRENAREFMELRRILEVEAAGLAAQRRSPEQLEAIRQALEQVQHDVEQGNLGGEADLRFHFAIAEAARNSFLLKLMNTVGDIMSRVLSAVLHILYQNPDNPPRIIMEHRAIYTAIKNGDPAGARRAMLEHLTNAEKYVFSNIEANK